ncbi:putative RNA polymerase sigma-K factor [[Clostridium] methylpentosum DSM 5476]|jgi:RNA polymerase sporulation-specific sigma factor|uniref:RNA polymerase sigma factor n=1 Tax=[Clostridium] methylpentosum DSM 5476 TaxID=537013 RepID=C0EC67_9FIRM|nr:putative RNA polymerase sigma-K factor [[Clostridium] methylpentosum DSM 5476]MDY3989578.1 RNA polymerase sporulation sigma factor SigK [Massilioclostridium sp.]MEE1491293.1 RNA polymerase sporulation sigma factor SigK [Massilioclostridium sp.]
MFSTLISLVMENLLYFALHVEGNGTFPKPLTLKQEKESFELMKQGDSAARDRLIEHNLRLVAHIAKKYYSVTNEQDDLISIGTIGLIKAVGTFDYTKGTRFATYASRCIENEILMHFRNVKKTAGDVYINDTIDTDKDGNSISLIDVIADETNIVDTIDLKLKSEQLHKSIKNLLTEREQMIVILRYGLNGHRPMTQREVADRLKISRSYVSRIEKKSLEQLKTVIDRGDR